MVDPDAPSRAKPRFRSWKHWVVINIPGANVAKGRIIARYLRPAPPKKTGSHRYVFLVYKQANGKIRNFKKWESPITHDVNLPRSQTSSKSFDIFFPFSGMPGSVHHGVLWSSQNVSSWEIQLLEISFKLNTTNSSQPRGSAAKVM